MKLIRTQEMPEAQKNKKKQIKKQISANNTLNEIKFDINYPAGLVNIRTAYYLNHLI
jgi:hypothetical protein